MREGHSIRRDEIMLVIPEISNRNGILDELKAVLVFRTRFLVASVLLCIRASPDFLGRVARPN